MMKKTVALIMAAMFTFSLCACSGNDSSSEAASQVQTEAQTEPAPAYVGTWKPDLTDQSVPENMSVDLTLIIKADNTFELTTNISDTSSGDVSNEVESGTCQADGDKITLTLTHYTMKQNGKEIQNSDVSGGNKLEGTFSGNKLDLTTGAGAKLTFVKQ